MRPSLARAQAPLKGYRVLDMSRVLAGPWASQMLADLGAEVFKIERPNEGDDTRKWGPPYLKDLEGKETGDAAYFFCCNRGKQSITVDITKPEGQTIIQRLAKQSDVLIENYKVGGLKKYGLDFESLEKINPKLVYCSITGFGQTGPYAKRPGYDFLIQGMGGLMSVTGEATGLPMKVGVAVTDVFTGLYASNAIQGALLERNQSGKGQHIDLALLDVQAAVLANQASNYLIGGHVPERLGNAHPNIVPYQAFQTADGHVIVAVGNDSQFQRFCSVLEQPQLADDKDFASNQARVQNREILCEKISEMMILRTSKEWLERLENNDVPCGPINTIDQVFENEQLVARNMVVKVNDARAGTVDLVANPIKYSRSVLQNTTSPPALGENTEHVLETSLYYSDSDIKQLRDKSVI